MSDKEEVNPLAEFEKHLKKMFDNLDKPSDETVKTIGKENPQAWRDEYFFNNGVKAMMGTARQEVQYMTRLLRIAIEGLDQIDEQARKKVVADINAVKKEDFK